MRGGEGAAGGTEWVGLDRRMDPGLWVSGGYGLGYRSIAGLPQFTHHGARRSGAGGAGSGSRRSSLDDTFFTGPIWTPSALHARTVIFLPDAPGGTIMPRPVGSMTYAQLDWERRGADSRSSWGFMNLEDKRA